MKVEIVLSDIVEGLLANQIQLVLNDAEKRQVSDEFVRTWLANFRDVAYDIDDVLDEFGYNILQQKTINESLNGLKDEIASFDLRVEFVNSSIPEISLKKDIDSFLDDPENVAQIMETPPQYELKELSESDCWSLFKKRAFANKRLLPQELVKIGMEIAKKCRRVPWALRVLGGTIDGFTKLRTLVSDNVEFGNMLSHFRCLRVLKLIGYKYGAIDSIGELIGELIHLRLLNISSTQIGELPKSISKLYNLQTLIIKDCEFEEYLELPEDLSNLINLRHIDIDPDSIWKIPKDMGRLTCLQTLPFFYVDQDEGRQIKELGCLNQLRGELDIYNLEYVRDKEEARSANLATKAKIYKLGFYWNEDRENDYNDEEVLEGLQPHQNLKSLTIKWYQGKKFPSWMLTSRDPGVEEWKDAEELTTGEGEVFPCLEELTIKYCPNLNSIPDLRGLHSLTQLTLQIFGLLGSAYFGCRCLNVSLSSLQLNMLANLNSLPDKIQRFTALKELHIEGFDVMEALPEWLGNFSSLQSLSLSKCKNLMDLSTVEAMRSLAKLDIVSCPKLKERYAKGSGAESSKIAHIQDITIDGERY
uniref:Rx N-terminal domain-containing protein n=1 Tax=Fagus sylvatica TaxID=28930 RepID=A0A2N9FD00_FAGSY